MRRTPASFALLAIVVAIATIGACATGRPSGPPPIVVTTDLDGGGRAPAAATDTPVAKDEPPSLPPGANGPADAQAMIGDPGKIVSGSPDMVLLVSSSVIRAHPRGEAFGKAITALLVGWDLFMPTDLIDPIKDVDWVLVAGSIMLGSTARNVFLARYNVSESRAETVTVELEKRLPRAKRETLPRHPKARAFSAFVDHALRIYVRPAPAVLLIHPSSGIDASIDLLETTKLPITPRPGELVRMAWNKERRGWASYLPSSIGALRLWMAMPADGKLHVYGEGDCENEAAAGDAAIALKETLERSGRSFLVRVALRGLVTGARVWADGARVRYDGVVEDAALDAASQLGCGSPPCR